MRSSILFALAVMSPALPARGQSSPPAAESVAILELKASGVEESIVANLTELFTAEAGKIPGYKVLGRSEVKELVGYEIEKQSLGCTDESKCMTDLGNALGADLVVTGTVGKVGDSFVLNIKLFDTKRVEARHRVGETVPGKAELLPHYVRRLAWQLLGAPPPQEVEQAYQAVLARLAKEDADAKGGAALAAQTERDRVQADLARAEAERSRAEAERLRAVASPKPEPPKSWQRTARRISTGFGVIALLGAGGLTGYSYWKANDVGDAEDTRDDGKLYPGTQVAAHDAESYQRYGYYSLAAGGVGLVAAIIFGVLEPSPGEQHALRIHPTGDGFAVSF